jgi:predicted kinase
MNTRNLIIVCGLQGTGKTTVATKISQKLRAELLRTDVIRKDLNLSQYTEEAKQRVYDEMISRTRGLLQGDKNVVLDATFIKQKNRNQAQQVALETNADFQIVQVISSDEVVKQRLEERVGDASEAGFEQYLSARKSFEPIPGRHITIDNSRSLDETLHQLNQYF